jgi:hypothetical protein
MNQRIDLPDAGGRLRRLGGYNQPGRMDEGMRRFSAIMICLGFFLSAAGAFAQSAPKAFVSPNKGQSQDQQNKDTSECQNWAAQQAPPSQAQTGPGTHARGTAGGAARGAAAGAAVGAIAGDAGKGAAAGAVVGGAGGRHRSKQQQQAAQASASNDSARAFAACMESRGYSVK